MYEAVTRDIKVSVKPEYLEDQSRPTDGRYFWAYTVTLHNLGRERVTLKTRHWRITDGNGRLQEVKGDGVVGEQPTLDPGSSFSYTSGCPLTTPHGFMVGSYQMVSATGEQFDIAIPAFSLDSPHDSHSLN